jgi:hypothetical protein
MQETYIPKDVETAVRADWTAIGAVRDEEDWDVM